MKAQGILVSAAQYPWVGRMPAQPTWKHGGWQSQEEEADVCPQWLPPQATRQSPKVPSVGLAAGSPPCADLYSPSSFVTLTSSKGKNERGGHGKSESDVAWMLKPSSQVVHKPLWL